MEFFLETKENGEIVRMQMISEDGGESDPLWQIEISKTEISCLLMEAARFLSAQEGPCSRTFSFSHVPSVDGKKKIETVCALDVVLSLVSAAGAIEVELHFSTREYGKIKQKSSWKRRFYIESIFGYPIRTKARRKEKE